MVGALQNRMVDRMLMGKGKRESMAEISIWEVEVAVDSGHEDNSWDAEGTAALATASKRCRDAGVGGRWPVWCRETAS
jgi:hypothetical protein